MWVEREWGGGWRGGEAERWRGMERDGEGWRGMEKERGGERERRREGEAEGWRGTDGEGRRRREMERERVERDGEERRQRRRGGQEGKRERGGVQRTSTSALSSLRGLNKAPANSCRANCSCTPRAARKNKFKIADLQLVWSFGMYCRAWWTYGQMYRSWSPTRIRVREEGGERREEGGGRVREEKKWKGG
jgi:hypothetical protein